MKKIISLTLALIMLVSMMAFTLTGCNKGNGGNNGGNGGNNGGNNGGDGSNLSGSITVWWPGGSSTTENAIRLAKEKYEAAHPGVTINIEFQGTADFYSSYTMALMGKNFPDVAYVDHVFVQRLAFDGLIANQSNLGLDSLKDQYIDSLWAPNLWNGSVYALPMSANILACTYNKGLLSTVYGREFTDADLPSNWDEYLAIGAKIDAYNKANNLTGNDKLYLTTVPAGTGAESMGAMYYLAYSARSGGTLMNAELTEMTLATEANMDAATKIKQLADLGYTTTVFSESKFETGKVAFIEMGPWKITDYGRIDEADESIAYDYTSVLSLTDGGDTSSTLGLYSLVITQKSKNQALAADFIKYVTTDTEIQLAHNTVQNLMPTTKEAIQNEYYTGETWSVFVNQLNNCVARPGSAAWPSIEQYVAEYVTGLINGTRNVDYIYALQAALTEKLEDLEDE
jgi:maltose-binding protein MalE